MQLTPSLMKDDRLFRLLDLKSDLRNQVHKGRISAEEAIERAITATADMMTDCAEAV